MYSLWKHYNKEYAPLEHANPPAFPWNREHREDVPRYIMGGDGYWYNPAAGDSGKALLSCTGDLMCEPRMTNACRFGDSYFFHPLFRYVRGIFKNSDFCVANLETTLSDSTPYAGEYHRIEDKFHCNAPKCYLDALRYAGFDAMMTANNHSCDSGITGLFETMDALEEYNFLYTGTFRTPDDERVLFVRINGIRTAFLSCSCHYNGRDTSTFTPEGVNTVLNKFSKEKLLRDVRYARERGAECIICYIHWGIDYDLEPGEKQLAALAELKECGVDYIVGSHTHCLQRHDYAQAEDGRRIPMMFSMGNFVTNEPKELCKHTGILQLLLTRENGGISIREYFIPCYVFDAFETGRFCVVPTDPLLNGGFAVPKLRDAEAYVRERVGDGIAFLPTVSLMLSDLCGIMGAEKPADLPDRTVTKLAVHVSPCCPGGVYFSDGTETRFETQELRRRELAAIVRTEPLEDLPCVIVPDVKQAYLRACEAVRQMIRTRISGAKIILVAGNEGKTLTGEMLGEALKQHAGTLTVRDGYEIDTAPWLDLHPYHEFCVQQLRADHPFGAECAVRAVAPDVCVITSATADLPAIAAGMRPGSILFANGADAALTDALAQLDTSHITVHIGQQTDVSVPGLPFSYMKKYASAAYACSIFLGVPAEKAETAIGAYRPGGYTQNILQADGVTLILQCACRSADAALSAADALAGISGRKLAVLGDADGENTPQMRRSLAEAVLRAGAEMIFCPEAYGADIREAAGDAEIICAEGGALERALADRLSEGDALLFCGGRKMQFCTAVRRLFGLTEGYIPNCEHWRIPR